MKTKLTMLVVALLLVPTVGCVWSLHPLYTQEDAVFEPGLVGVWASTEAMAIVKAAGDKSYGITYVDTSEDSSGKYRGRLVRLGDTLFLDLVPEGDELRQAKSSGLLATHLFFRLTLQEDTVRVEMVEDELLESVDTGQLRHEKLPDRYLTLLTASSSEIRAWLQQHAQNPQLYSDTLELQRVK